MLGTSLRCLVHALITTSMPWTPTIIGAIAAGNRTGAQIRLIFQILYYVVPAAEAAPTAVAAVTTAGEDAIAAIK